MTRHVLRKIIISIWRCPILFLLYFISNDEEKKLIREDVFQAIKWEVNYENIPFLWCLLYEMHVRKSSRNIYYFRTMNHKIIRGICIIFWPKADSVEIGATYIGGGLTIPHGNVILYAKTIGECCHVCPGVVVGQVKDGKYPVIGKNVFIGANSTILGDIVIGNNVCIGASNYIRFNIPDNRKVYAPINNFS